MGARVAEGGSAAAEFTRTDFVHENAKPRRRVKPPGQNGNKWMTLRGVVESLNATTILSQRLNAGYCAAATLRANRKVANLRRLCWVTYRFPRRTQSGSSGNDMSKDTLAVEKGTSDAIGPWRRSRSSC